MSRNAADQAERQARTVSRLLAAAGLSMAFALVAAAQPAITLGSLVKPAENAVSRSAAMQTVRDQRFLSGRQNQSHDHQDRSTGEQSASLLDVGLQHLSMLTAQASAPQASLSGNWQPLGPARITSPLYGNVTGRVTAIAIDSADVTGNTVYLGTTGGGVWKSTNAAGASAATTFAPLTDTLPVFSGNAGTAAMPSLSIGAISVSNGVVLAGTGDPNDNTDSYLWNRSAAFDRWRLHLDVGSAVERWCSRKA